MSLLLQCRQLDNTAGTRSLFTRVNLSINTKHGIEASQSRVHCKEFTGTLKIRRPESFRAASTVVCGGLLNPGHDHHAGDQQYRDRQDRQFFTQ